MFRLIVVVHNFSMARNWGNVVKGTKPIEVSLVALACASIALYV